MFVEVAHLVGRRLGAARWPAEGVQWLEGKMRGPEEVTQLQMMSGEGAQMFEVTVVDVWHAEMSTEAGTDLGSWWVVGASVPHPELPEMLARAAWSTHTMAVETRQVAGTAMGCGRRKMIAERG